MASEEGDIGGAAGLIGGAGGAAAAAPAAAAAASGTEAAAGGGDSAPPEWFEKVSADAGDGETTSNRDWLTSKGFKDIDAVVKSARFAEKAIHDKGRIAVPGDDAKPEDVAAFRTAIGVPEKVDGYEIKGPEGVPLNDGLINSLRESALKHGAPKGAFEGLLTDFIQLQLDEATTETKRQDDLAAAKVAEWGGKKDEMVAHIDTACRALKLTKNDMTGLRNGLGADRALDLLAKLGSGMAEDSIINPGGDRKFGVTGAEAKVELDKLKLDPEFAAKAMKPGTPERARWDRLNAAVGQMAANAS